MELTQFDFGKALSFLKSGLKVTNPRGNILFMEDGKVYCIPKSQYPKGKREEVKLYWMLFFVKIGGYFKNSPAIYRLPNTKIIKYGFSKLALNAINSITKI